MKIGILGAGGCFGTNLAAYASKEGHRVFGIGRSPIKPHCFSLGVWDSLPYYPYHISFELDYVLERINSWKPDVLISFAAQGEGAASWGPDNWRFFDTNCTALARLVSAINCQFIQIGSSEVYGSVNAPVNEQALTNPTSPYSVSKLAFDQYLIAMHKVCKLPMNIIRPSNCYAPGQQLHRIIPKALISGLAGKRIPLHGWGIARKSYLHATDLSRAILLVIEKAPHGEIYNVGPDNPTAVKEVVERCAQALGMKFEDLADMAPERTGQDSCYWLDSSKIKGLGWTKQIGWSEGLGDMLRWVRRYPELQSLPTEFRMRA